MKILKKLVMVMYRNSSTTRDNEWYVVRYTTHNYFAIFGWDMVLHRWSSGKCTHDLRRSFRKKELRVCHQEALPSRINPFLGHFPWLLFLLAPRRWPSSPSSDFSMSWRVSSPALLRSLCLTMCMVAPDFTTISLSFGTFVDAAGSTHSSEGE